jgi:hypothetical protein
MSWATPLAGFEVTQLVGFQLAEGPASTFWCKAQKKSEPSPRSGTAIRIASASLHKDRHLHATESAVPQFRISKSE